MLGVFLLFLPVSFLGFLTPELLFLAVVFVLAILIYSFCESVGFIANLPLELWMRLIPLADSKSLR